MAVDVAVLIVGVIALSYSLLQALRIDAAPRPGTSLQRTRTVYVAGVIAGCLMIAGAVMNLLGA
jgi:hypothetical protein